MKSMNKIGKMEESCGSPAGTWEVALRLLSSCTIPVLWVAKQAIQRITLIGHFYYWSLQIRWPSKTVSKALSMSSAIIEKSLP